MKKLINGIVDFRNTQLEAYRSKFSDLAFSQNPDALFIACCDSRVVPNVFASTDPGDLFVVRNIGNLIPPHHAHGNISVAAAIEFATNSLSIADIIICGHSSCGAMENIIQKHHCTQHSREHIHNYNSSRSRHQGFMQNTELPALEIWLENAMPSYEKFLSGYSINGSEHLSANDKLSQINVLQQLEHLRTYPAIMKRLLEGKLSLQGWWFDLATADVYHYVTEQNKFIIIDQQEADRMLAITTAQSA